MKPRQLIVIFLVVTGISLLVLLVLFNLVFEKLDLTFKTRLPDAAPQVAPESSTQSSTEQNFGDRERPESPSAASSWFPWAQSGGSFRGVQHALLNVPGDTPPMSAPRPPSTIDPESGESLDGENTAETTEPSSADDLPDAVQLEEPPVMIPPDDRASQEPNLPDVPPAPSPRSPAQTPPVTIPPPQAPVPLPPVPSGNQ